MIKLITLEGDRPVISAEARTIEVFRKIIERDHGKYGAYGKSSNKTAVEGDHNGKKKIIAMLELSFVYFFCDPRSMYWETYKNDEEARYYKIKKVLGLPEEWVADRLIDEAIGFYKNELKEDFDIQQLEAGISAAAKTKDWLKDIDYSLVDAKTKKPIYDPLHVSKVNKELGGVLESLKKLREKVYKSDTLRRNIRGGGQPGAFEDE